MTPQPTPRPRATLGPEDIAAADECYRQATALFDRMHCESWVWDWVRAGRPRPLTWEGLDVAAGVLDCLRTGPRPLTNWDAVALYRDCTESP